MQPEQQQRIMGYFIEEAKDHLNTIEQGLVDLQSTIEDTEMVQEVYRAAHSVKGGAGMLGLTSIHKTAHRLEDYFQVLKDRPVKVDSKLESLFLQVFDTLQALLEPLQGQFGLTEEVANKIMAGAEPVFEELHQHLNQLTKAPGIDRQALQTAFQEEVLVQLREMLRLFKQPDQSLSRQQLQTCCTNLERLGEKFEIPAWSRCLQTAKAAIADRSNPYSILAKVVIKEIKQAQDLVLANRSSEIDNLAQMQGLVSTQSPPLVPAFAAAEQVTHPSKPADEARNRSRPPATPFNYSDTFIQDDMFGSDADALFGEMGNPADTASGKHISADPHGPEVGMAELNSLADLFEGESPELDENWQEEEILESQEHQSRTKSTNSSNLEDTQSDFSDLLGDLDQSRQPVPPTAKSNGDDLASLFGDNFLDDAVPEESAANGALEDFNGLFGADFLDSASAPTPSSLQNTSNGGNTYNGAISATADEEDLLAITASSDRYDAADPFPPDLLGEGQETLSELFADADENDDLFVLEPREQPAAKSNGDSLRPPFNSLGFDPELGNSLEIIDPFAGAESDLDDLFGSEATPPPTAQLDFDDLTATVHQIDDASPQSQIESPRSSGEPEELFWIDDATEINFDEFGEGIGTTQSWENGLLPADESHFAGEQLPSAANYVDEFDFNSDAANDFNFDEPQVEEISQVSPEVGDNLNDFNFDEPQAEDSLFAETGLEISDIHPETAGNLEDLFGATAGENPENWDMAGDLFGEELPAANLVVNGNNLSTQTTENLEEWFDSEPGNNLDLEEANRDLFAVEANNNGNSEDLFDLAITPTPSNAEENFDDLFDSADELNNLAIAPTNSSEEGSFDNLFDGAEETLNFEDDLFASATPKTALGDDWELDFSGLENQNNHRSLNNADEWGELLAPPTGSLNLEDDFGFDLLSETSGESNPGLDELESLLGITPIPTTLPADDDVFVELDYLLSEEPGDVFARLEQFLGDTSGSVEADDFADLEMLLDGKSTPELPAAKTAAPAKAKKTADDIDIDFDELQEIINQATKPPGANANQVQQTKARPPVSRGFEQTMRVPVKHLDSLSNLVGELVVNRNTLEQDQERLRQFLDNLLTQVQQLSDVGARMQDLYERSLLESSLLASRQGYRSAFSASSDNSRNAPHPSGADYDPLEMDRFTNFHLLSQEMIELIVRVRESASDIEFLVDETDQVARMLRQITTQLQEGLTRSRMVPFAQSADRLQRGVRDNALRYGKQVKLYVEGRETLLDKVILEHLSDPLTHMLNNAIAHGVEMPEVRQAAGKPPVGLITIRAFHQGNQTVISVSDDGAGIDTEKVKAKALKTGIITAEEAKKMSKIDIYDLLFLPSFSTKDKADELAGRGVGMDVVRTSLTEIRGTITTDSTLGKGTTFTIRLPLTLSICKALRCVSDRAHIAFPMDGVEDMMDIGKERIQHNAEGQTCIAWRDTMLPFQPLSELLAYNRHISRGNVYGGKREDDMISIVVLRSAGTYIAISLDQVLGEQEIVIKQIEGPVPKPIGIAGATVLGDGRIMPIADVLELIDLSMGRIRKESSSSLWDKAGGGVPAEPLPIKSEPMVLIVDDSITVRELLSMTFNKSGYRVEQARDGQEAWDKLRSGLPCDIVFCDIEMPRMDGLELLSRIQKDETLNHLPVAMLTSRGADRHRQMAAQLGASGYFTKPYLEEALLDAAQRMMKGEVLLTASTSA
jgi:chemosensory pili system protein ChpA (sensor histidine kinase/response regulator)